MRLTAVAAGARVPRPPRALGRQPQAALLEEVAGVKVEIVSPDGR